jgi:hypothetical protein
MADAEKRRMAVQLSRKARRRLGAACVFFEITPAEAIEGLINAAYRDFRVVVERDHDGDGTVSLPEIHATISARAEALATRRVG